MSGGNDIICDILSGTIYDEVCYYDGDKRRLSCLITRLLKTCALPEAERLTQFYSKLVPTSGMFSDLIESVPSVNALAFSGTSTPIYALDKKKAIEFYEDARLAFPRMSKQDEARGRVCMRLLKGCATQEEKSLLATKETADIIVSNTLRLLQDRFIRRLLDEYAAAGLAGPRDLVAFKDLTVSSVENRVSTLERKAKGSKLRMFNSLSAAEINQLAPRPESHQPAMNTLKRKA